MNSKKMKSFSSFTLSDLFKVTKFFVKISQFEFLVTTEQSIFVYKLFLSLNIPDSIKYSFIFCRNIATSPEKSPLFPSNPPSKTWGPVKPPIFEKLAGG